MRPESDFVGLWIYHDPSLDASSVEARTMVGSLLARAGDALPPSTIAAQVPDSARSIIEASACKYPYASAFSFDLAALCPPEEPRYRGLKPATIARPSFRPASRYSRRAGRPSRAASPRSPACSAPLLRSIRTSCSSSSRRRCGAYFPSSRPQDCPREEPWDSSLHRSWPRGSCPPSSPDNGLLHRPFAKRAADRRRGRRLAAFPLRSREGGPPLRRVAARLVQALPCGDPRSSSTTRPRPSGASCPAPASWPCNTPRDSRARPSAARSD